MFTADHPRLGALEFEHDGGGYWSCRMSLAGAEDVEVEIECALRKTEVAVVDVIRRAISELDELEVAARASLVALEGTEPDATTVYIGTHLPAEEAVRPSTSSFVEKLEIVKVHVVDEPEEGLHLQFDYSIDPGSTNYLLVVWMNPDGAVSMVGLES